MTRNAFWLLVAITLLLAVVLGLAAPVSQHAAAAAGIAPVNDAWRAALPADPMAATQAYMARLSPAARARSDAYFEGGYWLQGLRFALGVAAAWIIAVSGTLVRFRAAIDRRVRFKWIQSVLLAMLFMLLSAALTLPLTVYEGFYREHLFGLANQTFLPWMGQQAVSAAIAIIAGGLFISLMYAVLRRAPRTWWIWGSVLGVGFLSFMLLIGPVYIDPLFNTYKPLADERIKQPILAMARANGVPADNIYQFDASRQDDRVSANVSGIFGTAAIRLNDNLLKRASLPEIKGVMGHELGHYVLNHIYKMLLSFGLILVLGFAYLKWSYGLALQRWGARLGIRDQSDPAGLPLLAALFSIYLFAMTPIINSMIRVQEGEADLFGLNASQEPDGFAEVDLKLTEYRKADPGPIEEFIFFDHPSPRKRIFAAMRWKAEHLHTSPSFHCKSE